MKTFEKLVIIVFFAILFTNNSLEIFTTNEDQESKVLDQLDSSSS